MDRCTPSGPAAKDLRTLVCDQPRVPGGEVFEEGMLASLVDWLVGWLVGWWFGGLVGCGRHWLVVWWVGWVWQTFCVLGVS